MPRNRFLLFVGLEFAAILITLIAFALIQVRPVASVVAATPFILVGLYMIIQFWQTGRPLQYAAFYLAIVHVIMTAVIGLRRVMFWDLPLEEILMFDVPLPVYHKGSQTIFWALIIATCYDMFREQKRPPLPARH